MNTHPKGILPRHTIINYTWGHRTLVTLLLEDTDFSSGRPIPRKTSLILASNEATHTVGQLADFSYTSGPWSIEWQPN